jgi:hypothetical protein
MVEKINKVMKEHSRPQNHHDDPMRSFLFVTASSITCVEELVESEYCQLLHNACQSISCHTLREAKNEDENETPYNASDIL